MAPKNQASRRQISISRSASMPKWRAHSSTSTTGTGLSVGQPKARRSTQLLQKVFGQSDVAVKVGMLGVVKQVRRNDAVPALGLEHLGPIDQEDRRVPGGNVAITWRSGSGQRRGRPSCSRAWT